MACLCGLCSSYDGSEANTRRALWQGRAPGAVPASPLLQYRHTIPYPLFLLGYFCSLAWSAPSGVRAQLSNHRHQTRNAKATNRQGGVAAHVTTARVRAAVAPVLSLSALPPPVFIAGCVCNDYSSCARSCPGLPAVPSAASGLPEAFVESAAGFSRWLLLSPMFMRGEISAVCC